MSKKNLVKTISKEFFLVILSLSMVVAFLSVSAFATPKANIKAENKRLSEDKTHRAVASGCLSDGVFDLVTLDDVVPDQPVAGNSGKKRSSKSRSASTRTMPLLMIVIGFNDTPYNEKYDWGSTIFSQENGDWSLYKYYMDNSMGKFTFAPALESSEYQNGDNTNRNDRVNDGIVHVKVDMDHDDWVDVFRESASEEHMSTWANALSGAMTAADDFVDFSQYDANGNGDIDTNEMAIGFIVAGGEASLYDNQDESSSDYLTWAHASKMSKYLNDAPVCDEKRVDRYITIAEDVVYSGRMKEGEQQEDEDGFELFSDNWPETAASIQSNDVETIDASDGDVLYKFVPQVTGWYRFYSEAIDEEEEIPSLVSRILRSNGEEIARRYDDFSIDFHCEAGSIYYLQARCYDDGAVYKLGLRESTDPDLDENFDQFTDGWEGTAESIQLNDNKTVDTSDGNALFKFIPDETGWYAFYSESIDEEDSDPVGRVLNSIGEQIAHDDDGNGDSQFYAVFYGEEGKTYYLQARDYDGDEVVFKVGLAETEDPDPDPEPDDGDDDEEEEELYTEQAGIGTLAHELGHYLGLPDYYDVDYDDSGAWGNYEVGRISIMAGGNWCYVIDSDDEDSYHTTYRPCAFDAYSRVALGWTEPVEATIGESYEVTAQNYSDNTGYSVLKIPTDNEEEYYLIENRQFSGWDAALKTSYPKDDDIEEYDDDYGDEDDDDYGDDDNGNSGDTVIVNNGGGSYTDTGGLVMWHVDDGIFDEYEDVNTTDHRPALMPTYMEYDNYPEFKFIGSNVDTGKLFFDEEIYNDNYAATAGETIQLPVYSKTTDTPAARTASDVPITLSGTGNNITVNVGDTGSGDIFISDIFDGVPWKITADGQLLIGEDNEDYTFEGNRKDNFWPWLNYTDEIKSVQILGTVHGRGDMSFMFLGCGEATEFDLTGFDTSDVTSLAYMFANCKNIPSLNLSGFDTSNVSNMESMFWSCESLTSLNLSGFNTANVTNMDSMFMNCESLSSLNLSGFDTSSVANMGSMFECCKSLSSLDLSGFDTSDVTNMAKMFMNCESLTSLNLSGFDTSSVISMEYMFNLCSSLSLIDVSNFNTSAVTNMMGMFAHTAISTIDLSGFDTSNVKDMTYMFYDCGSLTELDISNFNTARVSRMVQMFLDCTNLTKLNISGFDTSNIVRDDLYSGFVNIFTNCDTLTDIALGSASEFDDDYLPASGWTRYLTLEGDEVTDPTMNNLSEYDTSYPGWYTTRTQGSEHTHILQPTESKAPTCTKAGNITYWTCTECSKIFSDENGDTEITQVETVIKALGHDMDKTDAKEPTCTETGNTDYWKCNRCKKYFSDEDGDTEITPAETVIKALGHDMDKTDAKEPTCTETGNTDYWKCNRCKKYFSDEDGDTEITPAETVIKALGHDMEKTDAKDPTCTEAGNIDYWKCSRCKKYFSDEDGDTEITQAETVIDALGHDMEKTDAKDPTCTEAGNIDYWKCSRCKKYFSDANGDTEITQAETVIKALGHDMEKTDAKDPTCIEAGNIDYWQCRRCKKYFSDANGDTEITQAETVINALGHNLEATEAKAATQTKDGNIAYWTCNRCSWIFSDEQAAERIIIEDTILERLDRTKPEIVSIYPKSGRKIGPDFRTVSVLASDNYQLDKTIIEYSYDDEVYAVLHEDTGINEAEHTATSEMSLDDLHNGDIIYVRARAIDAAERVGEYKSSSYIVDLEAPVVSNVSASYENGQIIVDWTCSQEEDLFGYRIYRKQENEDEWSLIKQQNPENNKAQYSYSDSDLSLERTKYIYKVEAVDQCGNTSSSNTAYIQVPDRTAPKAVLNCENVLEEGIEYEIDASLSTDNKKITSYSIDFGDGSTSTEKNPVHVYETQGEFTITLTVRDEDGNEDSTSKTVRVIEQEKTGTAKIQVVDDEGKALSGAYVYFNLGSEDQVIRETDADGYVVFTAEPGTYPIGCFIADNEHLPAKDEVKIRKRVTTEIRMTLEKRVMIEGRFETERMTLEEMREAGIDTSDPDNQFFVRVIVYLLYEDVYYQEETYYNPVTKKYHGDGLPGFNTGEYIIYPSVISWSGGAGGAGGAGGIGVDGYCFALGYLKIQIDVSALKEFFNVDLEIINNASSDFSMINNTVDLNVPEGLTVMNTQVSESSKRVNIPEIEGQSSRTISWILRGDELGDYNISADYSGILSGFNAPLTAKFETKDPITVYGLSNLKLNVIIPEELHFGNLYYATALTNEGDIDVYQPRVDADGKLLEAKTYNANSDIVNIDKQQYDTFNDYSDDMDTLAPGSGIVKFYQYTGETSFESSKQRLVDYFYEIAEGYERHGLQIEITTVQLSYFKDILNWHTVYSSNGDDRDFTLFDFYPKEEIEDLVLSTESTEYNPRLAHFLSVMARSIYTDELVYYNYQTLGFIDQNEEVNLEDSENYNLSGYFIKSKTLSDNSKLVFITIRGSVGYNWNRLLEIGISGLGTGKYPAMENDATNIYNKLVDYLGGLQTENVTYVITGHSQGAGAGNLLAAKLYDNGVPTSAVYDYNFACPNVACLYNTWDWNPNGVHDNIFNIGNIEDVVPFIPSNVVHKALAGMIPIIGKVVEKSDWGKFGRSYWFEPANYHNAIGHDMLPYVLELSGNPELHDLEYAIAHLSLDYVLKLYQGLGFFCPVDVIIYDKAGNPVASVINDEPNYYDSNMGDVLIFVDGDHKFFYLPDGQEYDVQILSTDDGEMTYFSFNANIPTGEIVINKIFESVSTRPNKKMISTVGGDIESDMISLYVVDEEDNIISRVQEDGRETAPDVELISIKNAEISGINDKTYTGQPITQSVTVKVNDTVLTMDTDYTVSYSDNTEIGTATVTIKGIGDYVGTVIKTFEIKAQQQGGGGGGMPPAGDETDEKEKKQAVVDANKALEEAKEFEDKDPADYPEGAYKEYQDAVKALETLLNDKNAKAEDIIKAKETLESAIKALKDFDDAKAFESAKNNAKMELDLYKSPADYREEQKTELAAAVAAGREVIDKAETIEQIRAALAAAKAQIDKIKTDAELTLEEAEAKAKEEAVKGAESLLRKADKYKTDRSKYTKSSYNKLLAAIEQLRRLLDSENSTSAEISAAHEILKDTISALQKKKAQPMKVKAVKYKVFRAVKLKRGKKTFKAVTVKKAKGKVTYKISGNKKSKRALKFSKKTGRITIKKGLKKGLYKIKIKVTAAGNDNYLKGSKTMIIKVRVK